MTKPNRLRVGLLFGGRSAEHDVSRSSAAAVARALDPERYEVVPVGITTDGRWVKPNRARDLLAQRAELPAALDVGTEELHLDVSIPGSLGSGFDVDVVIPLVHGPYGEDGTIQGLMEVAGIPYVGSGVLGSAVGMDKVMAKRAFRESGLACASSLVLRDGQNLDRFAERVDDELGMPVFVKPSNMGSSVGVSKARNRHELRDAIVYALRFDEWIVVEEAVAGREIEVAVLGDDPPVASVPGEVVPTGEYFSYDAKYHDDSVGLIAPADLPNAVVDEVRSLAVRAFEACRCDAMARVDFFFDDGGRGLLVNEVNTIPGFTPVSMYPRLWEVSGVPYSKLLDRLIEYAVARHDRRTRRAGMLR